MKTYSFFEYEEAEVDPKEVTMTDDGDDDDTDPTLDEEDMEENNLTDEEADDIVWFPPSGSAGREEKDFTDRAR